MRRPADPLLSLIVPVFNEEESIDIFLTAVEPFLEKAGLRFEIVFDYQNTHIRLLTLQSGVRPVRAGRKPAPAAA